jgi:hypothetical protein
MAFHKYANATVLKSAINSAEWDHVRRQALAPAPDFRNRESAKVIIQEYDPKRYLLSHCTIIASVDTAPTSQPIGSHMIDGFQIDRRFADYFVTPETSKYINNNNDCWERKLLLSCFKTFIGAENYVEHIQIPELSKGKIIDAAARNIGDSIYVDILVATDRRHEALVEAIRTGQLGTLSMGCSVEFTTCTKCGNVAEDETHLCPHIRYFKGSDFVDDFGKKRKIAELCGHIGSEPGSVKFIEASWVANPAFTGAVLRNILSPEEVSGVSNRLQVAFSQPPRLADEGGMQKAARALSDWNFNSLIAQSQDKGQGQGQGQGGGQREEEFEGASGGAAAPSEEDPIEKAVKDLTGLLREKAIEHVRKEIGKDDASHSTDDMNQNETIIKSALKFPEWRRIGRAVLRTTRDPKLTKTVLAGLILYKSGGWSTLKSAKFTGREILAVSRVLDLMTKRSAMAGESRVYQATIAVGGTKPYSDVESYLSACRQVIGRSITGSEAGALLEKGRLYSLGS